MHTDATPWIEKAEGDYESAIHLSKKRSNCKLLKIPKSKIPNPKSNYAFSVFMNFKHLNYYKRK